MPIDFLRQTFGLDLESQAEKYADRLKDDRSGVKKWGAGDMFNDMFAEGTQAEVEAAAKKLVEDRINKNSVGDIEAIKQSLAGTGVDLSNLTIKDNETETSYKARKSGLLNTGQLVTAAYAANPKYFDKSNVTSTGDIDSETTRAIEEKDSDLTNPQSNASVTKKLDASEARADRLEAESNRRDQADREYRRWSTEKDDAWRKHQSEKEDKRLDMQMELAQLDRADRREDRRIAREDKAADRRQQSIMMLIKGLAQLGQGFSL